jgi:hypothetical protein
MPADRGAGDQPTEQEPIVAQGWRKGLREKLVTCECHIEGLHLMKFDDDADLYLSIWEERQYAHKTLWRQRLRHIWRIIRKGRPWDDELVLGPEAVGQVVRFLLAAPDEASVYWTHTSSTYDFTGKNTA